MRKSISPAAGAILIALALSTAMTSCASGAVKTAYYDSLTVGDPDLSAITDGSYRGAHALTPPPGVYVGNPRVEVEVIVSDHRYREIRVMTKAVSGWPHLEKLQQLILEKQSLQVDALTRATSLTGKAYLKAVANAMGGAE